MKAGTGNFDNREELARAEELIKKYDTESRFRKLVGWRGGVVSVWLVAMSLFHLYAASIGTLTTNIQRSWHLLFTMVAVFLLYPLRARDVKKGKFSIPDVLLALISLVVNGYLILSFDQIVMRGAKVTPGEFVLGLVAIALLLEAGRRVLGWGLPILATVFLLYCYFGRLAPGLFQHRGYTLERIVQHMYVVPEGIYGVALGVSATFVFLFILFGAFLNSSGGARFFNDLAMATAGRMGGGPAKVAIFASALLGTINGSSIANTATTGAFTIPLMKKVGYKPHFAGAVEATSSTGGQIMPPVMGAAAFIMTEFLSVPYTTIMKAAIIPAILYFFSVFMSVHFTAKRYDLQALPEEVLPRVREVFKSLGHLMLPIILVIGLLVAGYTPVFSAFWGTISVFLVSQFRRETRMGVKKMIAALADGARSALGVAIAAFILPYMFVYNPQLLLQGVHFFEVVILVFSALVGIVALSGGTMGYLLEEDKIPERIILLAGGLCMIYPGLVTDLIGLGSLALVIVMQLMRRKRKIRQTAKI